MSSPARTASRPLSRLWPSLRVGIPAALIVFALLITAISVESNTRSASRVMEQGSRDELTRVMTRLQGSLEFLLKLQELERVRSELAGMGSQADLRTALLLDDDDRVLASLHLSDNGRPLAGILTGEDAEHFRHTAAEVRRRNTGSVEVLAGLRRVVGTYPVVLGAKPGGLRPDRVGVLYVVQDLSVAHAMVRAQVQAQALQFGAFLVLLAATLWVLLHLAVTQRANRLVSAVGQLAEGDLGTRIALQGNDEFARIGAAFDDLAARLQSQRRQLHASEQRLALALGASDQGWWDMDLTTGEARVSAEVASMLGLEGDDFLLTLASWQAKIHPDDRAAAVQAFDDYVAGKSPRYGVESRMQRKDGGWVWMLSSGRIVERDAAGRPLRMVGTHMNIDERKRAQEALRASEERMRNMLEQFPGTVFWKDTRSVYLGCNKAFAEAAGLDQPADIVGKTDFDLPWGSTEASAYRADDVVVMDSATPKLNVVETQHQAHGRVVWFETSKVPLFGPEGRVFGVLGLAHDITARVQAEQTMREFNAELERRVEERTAQLAASRDEADRANNAKSEFLSRMSHELRTPMNAILGFGQLLEGDAQLGDRRRGWVREIVAGGRHLLELINDVLDLARVESGRFALSPEPVALGPLIEECLTLLRPLADAAEVRVLVAAEHRRIQVRADRTRLKQVLLNLLSNAIKYNRRGGSVHIVCAAEAGGTPPMMQVRITDEGPGLTADEQTRLFTPFERLHADERRIEGTGIGLVLSRRLLEVMGGEIGVESTPGAGSTFSIRLPLATGKEHDAVAPPAGATALAIVDAGPRHDVLCIEDNPANLRLIESIFMHRPSIRLLSALAPGLGLELARTCRPQLILLDIHLPEMDGYAVMQCLRENDATRGIPVVAVSANAMPGDLERGKAAGFVAYVTKPIDMARLLELVDGLLVPGQEGRSG